LERLSIQPLANSHLSGYAPFIKEFGLANRMQCFSFLIRVGDKSFLYSSDLGSEDDIFPYLKNLDLLIIESTHINVARVVSRAVDDGVGKIVLTHIAEDYDTGQAIMTAQKIGFPGLVIAHDGFKIAL
jgi:ribonuclease BN (tRNA processing enzyme)